MLYDKDTKPDYDEWGPDTSWTPAEWRGWGEWLDKHLGAQEGGRVWARAWLEGLSRGGGGLGTAPGANAIVDSVPTYGRSDPEWVAWVRRSPWREAAVFRGPAAIAQTMGDVASAAGYLAREASQAARAVPGWLLVVGGLYLVGRKLKIF